MPSQAKPLYPLWPKQQQAMQLLGLGGYLNPDPVEELLYGGQAGGGKSYFLRALAVGLCLSYPGLVVPLFRRTYPELEETHIQKIQQELPPEAGKYKADRHEWRFPNGSVMEFRYCEREDDVYKYNSAEWDALLIDEATQFTGTQVSYLGSRVRTSQIARPNWRPIIVYSANPGGVGHHYFRDGFVKASRPGCAFSAPAEEGGARRAFLPATLDDNPALSQDYKRRLQAIKDKALKRALLEGDWDVFAGQVFSEFRMDKHVITGFQIPDHWVRWRSYDYGFAAPMCCLWFAKEPHSNRVFVYRELYGSGMTDITQVQKIKQLSKNERIRYSLADPAIWRKDPNGTSIAAVFANHGVYMSRASNDRFSGWQRVHEALSGDPPNLMIFENCVNLIRTLPTLTYDKTNVEDVDTDLEDHAGDALRYGLMGHSAAGRMKVVSQEFRVVA